MLTNRAVAIMCNDTNTNALCSEDRNDTSASLHSSSTGIKEVLYRVIVPVMLTLCIITIIGNCYILLATRFIRRTITPTLLFSISLAAADGYVSTAIALGLIVNSLLPSVFGKPVDQLICMVLVLECARVGAMITSVLHLLGLAINHYVGIVRPLHYQTIMTRCNTLCAIAIMWITPLAFNFIYFSSVPNEGFQLSNCAKYDFLLTIKFRTVIACQFFIPLFIMIFIYGHIYAIVKQHQSDVLKYQQTEQTRLQMKSNIKAVITTLLILGTYIIGWMPAVIVFITVCSNCIVTFAKVNQEVFIITNATINSLIIIKSFVDPIVYAARIPELQESLKRMHYSWCNFGSPPTFHRHSTLMTTTTSIRGASTNDRNRNRNR